MTLEERVKQLEKKVAELESKQAQQIDIKKLAEELENMRSKSKRGFAC